MAPIKTSALDSKVHYGCQYQLKFLSGFGIFENRAEVVYAFFEMKAGFQCSGFRFQVLPVSLLTPET